MFSEEVLKAVFPLLDSVDLASCMAVCRQWRDMARDDYYWKCFCAKRWPSVCKQSRPPTGTYHRLYQVFYNRKLPHGLPPPRLSFEVLEFFIDIWAEDRVTYSEAIPGDSFQTEIKIPASGVSNDLIFYLEGPIFKMIMPAEPRLTMPVNQTTLTFSLPTTVSLLVGRKDCNKVAWIMNRKRIDCIDFSSHRAFIFEYLDLSPFYPVISGIRAWISFLLMEGDINDEFVDVFGIELDFCDVAYTKEAVLQLFDMLDWK